MATNYLLDSIDQGAAPEDFSQFTGGDYSLDGASLNTSAPMLGDYGSSLQYGTNNTEGFGGNFASEADLSTDGLLGAAGNYNLTGSNSQSGLGEVLGPEGGAEPESMMEKVGSGMATVNKFFAGILGEKGAQALYGSAIAAGASALLASLTGANKQIDYRELQDDRQAHEKELLTTKYAREDAERERKNKIAPRTGRINYKPQATAGYQAPGKASGTMYGLLGSK